MTTWPPYGAKQSLRVALLALPLVLAAATTSLAQDATPVLLQQNGADLNIGLVDTRSSSDVRFVQEGDQNLVLAGQGGDLNYLEVIQGGRHNQILVQQNGTTDGTAIFQTTDARPRSWARSALRRSSVDGNAVLNYQSGGFGLAEVASALPFGQLGRSH